MKFECPLGVIMTGNLPINAVYNPPFGGKENIMFNWKEMNAFSAMDLLELANNFWSKLGKLTAKEKAPVVTTEKSAGTTPPPESVSDSKKSKADEATFSRILAQLKTTDPDSFKEIQFLMATIGATSKHFADDFRVFILNVPNRMDEIKKTVKSSAVQGKGPGTTKEISWVRNFTFTQRDARIQILQFIARLREEAVGSEAQKNQAVIHWLTVETHFVEIMSPEQARFEATKKWLMENAPNLKIAAAIAVIGNERSDAIIAEVATLGLRGKVKQAEIESRLLAAMQQRNEALARKLQTRKSQFWMECIFPAKKLGWTLFVTIGGVTGFGLIILAFTTAPK